MKRIIHPIALLAALLALLSIKPAQAVTIDFVPASPYNVTAGGSLSVDVVVSNLGSQVVSAYDMDIIYNASILAPGASPVLFGPWLGDPLLFEVLENVNTGTPGLLDFAAVSLLSDTGLQALQAAAGGTFTLATLNFDAIGTGSTALAFSWSPGNDVKGLSNAVIFPTPEPGTLLLIAAGAAVAVLRRNRA